MKPKRNFVEVRRLFGKEPGRSCYVLSRAIGFFSMLSQTLNAKSPPSPNTLRASRKRRCLVGNKTSDRTDIPPQ